ncbi:uncharacterized protein LOC132197803 [Neocloeon triangulifer]|uniref:uncharacterized protein LOC132197803 n=1 Tax=Neocloeon triangulifer TaxID=2078957 RepID=UPI00286F738F|nr:uncharacterized protein LOC132197803 [Neocloeon triangulifer]
MEEEPKYEVPYAATNVQTSVKIEMPKRSQVEKTSKFSRKALTRTVPWVLCVFFSFLTTCILLGKIIVDDARLDYLTKLTERQQWLIPYKISINCTLARSHNLMQLSNGKKYFFSYPTREYWSVANEKCKEMGLHLATLRDEADLDATWTEANKRIHGNWWLSAKNYANQGKYNVRWSDGSELEENSILWSDDVYKLRGCVYFKTSHTKKLKISYYNTNYFYYICELPTECY